MLKPSREDTIEKLITVYKNSFSTGSTLIKPAKERKTPSINDPSNKILFSWKTRDYTSYFTVKYKEIFELEYKLSYESDAKIINQILLFLQSLGTDYKQHCKKFIDWCFENRDLIIKRSQYFTLLTCKNFINEYIQFAMMDIKNETNQKTTIEYDFLSDLDKLYNEKKMLMSLKRYGIVIIATYLFYQKKLTLDQIIENINKLNLEESDYEKISRTTIIRSPYLDEMILKNWRELFEKFKFWDLPWWRTNDYYGNIHHNYKDLIK